MQLTNLQASLYTQRMEKSARWWDLPSAVLLLLAVLFSAWRLQTTDWTEGLNHVRNLSLLGLMIGLALGQSRFQKRGITLLVIGYTLVFFIWQWLGFIEFTEEQTYLGDQLLILFGRLWTDLNEFFSGRPVESQMLVVVLLSLPYWFTGLFSGYQQTRHANYLASILPHGILMLFVFIYHYTTKDYTWMFGAYIFIALLLLGRQKYLADRRKWLRNRVQVSSESSLDINNTSMVIAAALVMLAWSVPYILSPSVQAKEIWQRISGDWFSGEQYENLFKSVNKEKKPQPRNFQAELPLGTQTSLGELVVFLVYAPSNADEFPRLYWRGQVYDRYENSQWVTTGEEEARHNQVDGDLEVLDKENRRRLTFAYDVYTEGQIIMYSAAQPIWLNHSAIVLHSRLSDDPEDETMDVMALRASPMLEAGDLYRMAALMANPTIPELQATGQDYPDWVTEKYLQLPDDFSPRIRSLAREITAEYDAPYDKTVAITNYLRAEIRYTPGINLPREEDLDPIEYFLFEGKEGFCNYYASAQVLMLRSIGIPARLAVGYAQGEPNLQSNMYTVRERDLHAWPEVYFPGYGWIEFEPTGNQQPLDRPLEREERIVATPIPNNPVPQAPLLDDEIPTLEPIEDSTTATLLSPSQVRLIGILGGMLLAALAAVFIKNRLAPHTPVALILKNAIDRSGFTPPRWLNSWLTWLILPPIQRYFHSVNTGLRWLGRSQPIHSTAAERAATLQKMLPDASPAIETLLREHQTEMFTPRRGDSTLARRAALSILYKSLTLKLKIYILGYN